MRHVVIIGAGQAGVQVAHSLRERGYGDAITLVGDENAFPYQRPPLSKDFLAEGGDPEPLPLRGERFFAENRVDLRTGVVATAIDRGRRVVVLDDGEDLPYTHLVLATGAVNRTLSVPGRDLHGVYELRSLRDAVSLREALDAARSVVVVGAGFIGLEFAAVVRKRGIDVTVLEMGERPLGRAVSPEMSDYISGAHRRMGTDLRLGEGLAALTGGGASVSAALGTSGREYPADLVLLGVGVGPRDQLARAAGLSVDNGIVVDGCLRTADPAVYAVGDCASLPGDSPDKRLRLESVQNATDQARHVADTITGGRTAYAGLPWFWSNQGPVRLQIVGLTQPGDSTLISGDIAEERFSVLRFREEGLVAVESINRPADHIAARRVLAAGGATLTLEQAGEPAFTLKDHAR